MLFLSFLLASKLTRLPYEYGLILPAAGTLYLECFLALCGAEGLLLPVELSCLSIDPLTLNPLPDMPFELSNMPSILARSSLA